MTNPLPVLLIPKRSAKSTPSGIFAVEAEMDQDLFPRSVFMKMLCVERQRAERSGRKLVVALVDCQKLLRSQYQAGVKANLQRALSRATRETDIKGWYRESSVIGVVFTEVALAEKSTVQVLSRKLWIALQEVLGPQQVAGLQLSFHVFPEDSEGIDAGMSGQDTFSTIYPDLEAEVASKRVPLMLKRCLDTVGSLLAILVLAPLMILIAAAIKFTSPGPVLFRQTRLGQHGKSFVFLKFRSMHAKADPAIHEAYVRRFISNKTESPEPGGDRQVFKLQTDPRITRVGRFLRRTSLDEIPQFFNVLAGHMSLVGPRPPLPYEFARYEIWHRRRLRSMKPGITGLWQVEGRSRVKFDEMVRMDIAYASKWSLWTDIKILWRTPRAVVSGSGAC